MAIKNLYETNKKQNNLQYIRQCLNLIALALSCCEHKPFRFLGMFISILARTIVILDNTKQTCARPSCIIIAATSARFIGSQASSIAKRRNYKVKNF